MSARRGFGAGFLACTLPALAWAHPGHGTGDAHTVMHYMTEPLHVAVGLGALVLGAAGFTLVRWRRQRQS